MTDTEKTLAQLVAEITPAQLRAYLTRHGWTRRNGGNPLVEEYRAPALGDEEEPFDVVAPARVELRDYQRMMLQTLSIVADLVEVEPQDLATRILFTSNLFRFRLQSEASRHGTLPLSLTPRIIQNLTDLITYSACLELVGGTARTKRKLKDATTLAQDSRFGQTKLGSYVFNVYVPLPAPPVAQAHQVDWVDTTPPDPEVPLAHRALARVINGAAAVVEAVKNDDEQAIVDNVERGFNGNMCESLVAILECVEDPLVALTVDFDPLYPPPTLEEGSTVELAHTAKKTLAAAANSMRIEPERRETEVSAYIYELRHDARETQNDDYQVKLIWENKGQVFRARASLTERQYQDACQAHKDEKRVIVTGVLKRAGKQWAFEDLDDLKVGGEESE